MPHLPTEIVFAHLPRSDALEAAIHRRVEHLSQYCADLHACRVVVEHTQRHTHQGRPFEVRVEARIHGMDLVANHSRHEDVYVALREAFHDMTRQVEETARRRRAGPHYRETVRGARRDDEPTLNAVPRPASSADAGAPRVVGTDGPSIG